MNDDVHHLNHTISQHLQVSFPHQGFTFYVAGILTEGLGVEKFHSDAGAQGKVEMSQRCFSFTFFICKGPNVSCVPLSSGRQLVPDLYELAGGPVNLVGHVQRAGFTEGQRLHVSVQDAFEIWEEKKKKEKSFSGSRKWMDVLSSRHRHQVFHWLN